MVWIKKGVNMKKLLRRALIASILLLSTKLFANTTELQQYYCEQAENLNKELSAGEYELDCYEACIFETYETDITFETQKEAENFCVRVFEEQERGIK